MTDYQLSRIMVYPVKSLAGINVSAWPVTATGLQYDRKWMLIDAEGQFLSQRRLPKMALISTALTEDTLILSAPNREALVLPLSVTGGESVACKVWQDDCVALSVSAEADAWLSAFLGQPCRLVYQTTEAIRSVDPKYGQATDQVAFSDGFPFLIVSENSLDALNKASGLTLTMNRFRPNLVISGCPAYDEDRWRVIRIAAIDFRLPKPCSRCSVPNVDPETALCGKEPLTTLNRTRKWQNKVYFGQNALHNQSGMLTVGDAVTVVTTGEFQPPRMVMD